MTTTVYVSANASDDTQQIRDAIAALQASGSEKKTIILEGHLRTSEAISVSADPGVFFDGVGCTWEQLTADTPTLQLSNLSQGGARNIEFTHAAAGDNAISVTDCEDLVFSECRFSNYTGPGVTFSGTCTGTRFDEPFPDAEGMVELLKEITSESRSSYCRRVYSYSASAQAIGASPYELLTAFWWFDNDAGSYDRSRVHPATVADGIAYSRANGGAGPAMMNIEEWNSHTQSEEMLANCRLAAQMWRSTSRDLGFYRLVPHSVNYFSPAVLLKRAIDAGNAEDIATYTAAMREFMRADDWNMRQLSPYVDYLAPRCYVSYNTDVGLAEWKWYASYTINEALRICQGKPVLPVVWWYANGSDEALAESRWIESLQWVAAMPGIAGIFLYSGGTEPSGYTWTDAVADLINAQGDFA